MTRRLGILLMLLTPLMVVTGLKQTDERPVDPNKSTAELRGEAFGRWLLPASVGLFGLYLTVRKKRPSKAEGDAS